MKEEEKSMPHITTLDDGFILKNHANQSLEDSVLTTRQILHTEPFNMENIYEKNWGSEGEAPGKFFHTRQEISLPRQCPDKKKR